MSTAIDFKLLIFRVCTAALPEAGVSVMPLTDICATLKHLCSNLVCVRKALFCSQIYE